MMSLHFVSDRGGFLKKYKKYFIYLVVVLALTGLYHALKLSRPVMNVLTNALVPLKRALSAFFGLMPFSAAEFLVAAAFIFSIYFVIASVIAVIRGKDKLLIFFRRFLGVLCAVVTVYFGMCLMLGTTYYSDNFLDKSGMDAKGGTVDELYRVTKLFAEKVNETGALVSRDKEGVFSEPLDKIFDNTKGVYSDAEKEFPFLSGPERKPKRLISSPLFSYLNFTGFYFPFTAEANINVECPSALIPATIAHEMAHQRGVAAEQEANFAAIAACVTSGKAEYAYSGWLLGYIYLSNELCARDYDRFTEVYYSLSKEVTADLNVNNEYWARHETKVSKISDQAYDNFLKDNGQNLGIQSYDAVVNLLLAYYK